VADGTGGPENRLERRKMRARADEAHEICRRPLPDIEDLTEPDSAA